MSDISEIRFSPPSRNSRGFLRRMSMMLKFAAASQAGEATPEQLEEMVKFLAQYISNDIPFEDKVDIIWELSEEEFNQLMSLVQAGQERIEDMVDEGNGLAG